VKGMQFVNSDRTGFRASSGAGAVPDGSGRVA
jgi:hypothetical protein